MSTEKSLSKRALICGVSGQDGSYLAHHLISMGYEVFGTSRDVATSSFGNLTRLGIRENLRLISMAPNDFRSVLGAIDAAAPDEIYNLSGQSSVGLSFQQPVETLESMLTATVNILEAIRFLKRPARFYNACSAECFGNTGDLAASEETPFRPRSPYGVAKAAAFWQVANYREAYGLFACSGILFNHESPLRPERFVTSKIVHAARRIAGGEPIKLSLGNLHVSRDWGWAPEYVQAMHRMLQGEEARDLVIATGKTHTLEEFTASIFSRFGLDHKEHIVCDPSLIRPSDIALNRADPSLAESFLNWKATVHLPELAAKLAAGDLF
jgi:GDPmannose 4,6-dehydratase